jgi:hypothetical protein
MHRHQLLDLRALSSMHPQVQPQAVAVAGICGEKQPMLSLTAMLSVFDLP